MAQIRHRAPSGKHELEINQKAKDAIEAEWERLRKKEVWLEDKVKSWDEVRAMYLRGTDIRNHSREKRGVGARQPTKKQLKEE